MDYLTYYQEIQALKVRKDKLIEENRKYKERIIAITAKADKLRTKYLNNIKALNQIQREVDGLL